MFTGPLVLWFHDFGSFFCDEPNTPTVSLEVFARPYFLGLFASLTPREFNVLSMSVSQLKTT